MRSRKNRSLTKMLYRSNYQGKGKGFFPNFSYCFVIRLFLINCLFVAQY
jgi:hypothetical protein